MLIIFTLVICIKQYFQMNAHNRVYISWKITNIINLQITLTNF